MIKTLFLLFSALCTISTCEAYCCAYRVIGCCTEIYVPCNIFCCDCPRPCRRNNCQNLVDAFNQTTPIDAYSVALESFTNVDKNGDKFISKDEAETYLSKTGVDLKNFGSDNFWFTKIDVDLDGKIAPYEFDALLR